MWQSGAWHIFPPSLPIPCTLCLIKRSATYFSPLPIPWTPNGLGYAGLSCNPGLGVREKIQILYLQRHTPMTDFHPLSRQGFETLCFWSPVLFTTLHSTPPHILRIAEIPNKVSRNLIDRVAENRCIWNEEIEHETWSETNEAWNEVITFLRMLHLAWKKYETFTLFLRNLPQVSVVFLYNVPCIQHKESLLNILSTLHSLSTL